MKIQRQERYDEIKTALERQGILVDDTADLVLRERNRFLDRLMVRDGISGSRVILPANEVVFIRVTPE